MQEKSFSTSGHAVYSLNVHFVFVTKYRHATVTARQIRREFVQHLRAYYWKPRFWASSYAAFSVGSADLETVKRYIQNQERPH